jgi:hypothetical protein
VGLHVREQRLRDIRSLKTIFARPQIVAELAAGGAKDQ